jgi:hypothetical protein
MRPAPVTRTVSQARSRCDPRGTWPLRPATPGRPGRRRLCWGADKSDGPEPRSAHEPRVHRIVDRPAYPDRLARQRVVVSTVIEPASGRSLVWARSTVREMPVLRCVGLRVTVWTVMTEDSPASRHCQGGDALKRAGSRGLPYPTTAAWEVCGGHAVIALSQWPGRRTHVPGFARRGVGYALQVARVSNPVIPSHRARPFCGTAPPCSRPDEFTWSVRPAASR